MSRYFFARVRVVCVSPPVGGLRCSATQRQKMKKLPRSAQRATGLESPRRGKQDLGHASVAACEGRGWSRRFTSYLHPRHTAPLAREHDHEPEPLAP